jgi:tetratricopeptide (TPR) repeat protein
LYGQALEATGKTEDAVAEFRQAIGLDPKQIQVMIKLAAALEKSGDWVASMDEYRKASLADASIDPRGKIIRLDEKDPQKEYEAAQGRLKDRLAALRASGKSAEAAKIEAGIQAAQGNSSLSEQLDAEIQAGFNAVKAQHVDEAIPHFQRTVDLADKLQPHDERLVTSLDYLGRSYVMRDPTAARAAFERELKVAQELFGSQSFNLTGPLQSLARLALMEHDPATAEKFFFRAVDINEKSFGEGSDRVAAALVQASVVYFVQKDYAKAEPYLLRALHIDEALYGKDSIGLQIPLAALCGLYDKWNKPDKLESCDRQFLDVIQKQYGANSPVLVPLLNSDAKALRSMGKDSEAAQIDDRVASIRAATMKAN